MHHPSSFRFSVNKFYLSTNHTLETVWVLFRLSTFPANCMKIWSEVHFLHWLFQTKLQNCYRKCVFFENMTLEFQLIIYGVNWSSYFTFIVVNLQFFRKGNIFHSEIIVFQTPISYNKFVYRRNCTELYCVKGVRIWSFSGPYFPAFGMNTNQKNSEYGRFLCNVDFYWEPMLSYENIKGIYFFIKFFYQIHIISIIYQCSRSRDIYVI